MSIIVLGTDTGVGKTVVSALVALRYGASYWKPVATGVAQDDDPSTVSKLCHLQVPIVASRYVFDMPVAPHLAARQNNTKIDMNALTMVYESCPRATVVEGIGGALVPLNDRGDLFADWVGALKAPCVVVARTALGTINHTLLTLEALRTRQVVVAGVLLCGDAPEHPKQAIEQFGAVSVLQCLPIMRPLSAQTVAHAAADFDSKGMLEPYLQ